MATVRGIPSGMPSCLGDRSANPRTAATPLPDRALDHYLKPPLKQPKSRKPSKMFLVAPDMDHESLLAHVCESLASASVMTGDIAAYVDAPYCRRTPFSCGISSQIKRSQPSAAPTRNMRFPCRSCRRLRSFDPGGLTADQSLLDIRRPSCRSEACPRRWPYRQRCLLVGKNIRTFPHVFQVARRTLRL
ncbi:hypothetical protein SAMN04490191_0340 [Pseudomonas lini]|uniref:Uncharacterized protein n=1 Tax=Pseudomonas lini TaxID=163011 RepID=A0A1H1N6W7_9PSED|nr:hypothetical protein SAMN04490191_0340 [Pseudomonas lini]